MIYLSILLLMLPMDFLCFWFFFFFFETGLAIWPRSDFLLLCLLIYAHFFWVYSKKKEWNYKIIWFIYRRYCPTELSPSVPILDCLLYQWNKRLYKQIHIYMVTQLIRNESLKFSGKKMCSINGVESIRYLYGGKIASFPLLISYRNYGKLNDKIKSKIRKK
jgi:hypothetical protein